MKPPASTSVSGPTASAAAAASAPKSLKLIDLAEGLSNAKDIIAQIAEALDIVPGASSAADKVKSLSNVLGAVSDRIKSVSEGYEAGKASGGQVGGLLGGFSALLGPESGETNEDGDKSTLDKVREKVTKLSEIWTKYYDDLWDKSGKLNKMQLANMALEVGATVLGIKKMAKVRKAVAIASIIHDQAAAVMTAAKAKPFPFNLPAIGFAVATGVKQIAAANQAHAGLDKVPATATYLLEKGERVIGKRLNEDLSSFLNASNEGGVGGSISNSVSRTNTFNPTINLNVGDGASDSAVFGNRGAVETMIREIYADYALQSPFGA